ncbi:MAG TPA: hypothetical protein VG387_19200 [Rhizomicrobium sp.]|jgi:virulence-associated protein VagC|nr:hypothetical protein [Rhizomicrobium sp.]
MRTRAFTVDGRHAVYLPDGFAAGEAELELTQTGEEIVIRPARRSMAALADELDRMPKPDTVELLERTEVPERKWD